MTPMMIPTIHLNGTSKKSLLEDHYDVLEVIREAIYAMDKVAPNGRDFYPQGPDAINRALCEHQNRVDALMKVRRELEEITEAIND